jgi:MFS family permease
MRVGWQHVMQSPRMKVVLVRIFFFFLQSSALLALLPLVAREVHGAGPATYTLMLAGIGGGAVVAAMFFPRWRERFDRDQFVLGGTMVHALMSVLVVYAPNIWVALAAIVVLGMAWISTANSLTLAAQVALPNWVRARGMAIYQMALMGGAAAGSLLWGQVAGLASVRIAVLAASILGPLLWLASRKLTVEGGADPDYSPATLTRVPQVAIEVAPDEGPVMVTVEYQIDPLEAAAFAEVMQKTRRARLRQGVLSWGLFRDTSAPGRYIEYFVDESWVEHQRRLERFSAADAGLMERRQAFHKGDAPPVVRRFVAEGLSSPSPWPW